jgi:hypothetical protein
MNVPSCPNILLPLLFTTFTFSLEKLKLQHFTQEMSDFVLPKLLSWPQMMRSSAKMPSFPACLLEKVRMCGDRRREREREEEKEILSC